MFNNLFHHIYRRQSLWNIMLVSWDKAVIEVMIGGEATES